MHPHYVTIGLGEVFWGAWLVACETAQVRNRTHATAKTQAAAVTMPDP